MNTEEKRSKQIINNYGQELTTNLNYFTLKESSGINDYFLIFLLQQQGEDPSVIETFNPS